MTEDIREILLQTVKELNERLPPQKQNEVTITEALAVLGPELGLRNRMAVKNYLLANGWGMRTNVRLRNGRIGTVFSPPPTTTI